MRKKPNKHHLPIYSRINVQAAHRLTRVREEWGFRSNYQIIQYIIYSFIRVADIDNLPENEGLPPEEMEQIFSDLHSIDRNFDFVKHLRVKGLTRQKQKKRCKPPYVRVKANITPEQKERLTRIKQTCSFDSDYEVLQYAIACFVRALDKNYDPEPEPEEIGTMFYSLSDAQSFEYEKPKRQIVNSREIRTLHS